FLVEWVVQVSPQAQWTRTSWYAGWIFFFMEPRILSHGGTAAQGRRSEGAGRGSRSSGRRRAQATRSGLSRTPHAASFGARIAADRRVLPLPDRAGHARAEVHSGTTGHDDRA